VLGALLGLPAGAVVMGIVSALSGLAPLGVVMGILAAIILVAAGAKVLSMLLPEITIGPDGIASKGHLSSATVFTPFERLASVKLTMRDLRNMPGGWAIELEVREGTTRELATFANDRGAEARAVVDRIQEAFAAWSATTASTAGIAQLESAGAPVREWLTSLRKVATEEADYRHSPLTHEELLDLIENPTASAEHRVGAAVVLATKGDDHARDRIRIAAEATANPRLRVALTSVAQQDLEEEAIEEVVAAERG
jgi:hypothetical protein